MTPGADRLFEALEATWPPAGGDLVGPFRLRRGAGGGQRVSAAIWNEQAGPIDRARALAELAAAEARMVGWGQRPLFMLRGDHEAALDGMLSERGYERRDLSLIFSGAPASITAEPLRPLTAIVTSPELAICREIWSRGGVDAARWEVIGRAPPPATAILGRHGDDPAGVVLVAIDGPIAMVHALHVLAKYRRSGIARAMVLRAARWASAHGCTELAAAVVADNAPARKLFESLGLHQIASYHYRAAADCAS